MSQAAHDIFFGKDKAEACNSLWAAKRRLAAALRALNETVLSSLPDEIELLALAEYIEAKTAKFAESERVYGRLAYSEQGDQGGFAEVFDELNPLSGQSNPLSPPLNIWLDGDVARGEATMGWVYEGPPMCVHGGYIAALFDEFLGMAQMMGKNPGMTGTLSIRYQSPTPINTPLALSAWLDRNEGRKTIMRGEISANGVVTATAEGLFIRPKQGMLKGPDLSEN